MNKSILLGRVVRDAEVRYNNEMCIARYTLAVNRMKKDEADFISCVAFGKQGEFAEKYLQKGTKILIEGRITTGSYTNKDGQKVYTTDVIVDHHEFVESKQQGSTQNQSTPNETTPDGFVNVPDGIDEELPFN